MKIKPLYVTGNQHKAHYLAKLLGIELDHHKVDLDEIQSTDLDQIVEHKVRQAYAITGQPVLVEDVALGFDALGGLPGPFIKFFIESEDGAEKLCRMCDGLESRRATAYATFGYYDGDKVQLFHGSIAGSIAEHPSGSGGYGWDVIFIPDGYGGRIRSELSEDEYDELYQVIKPIPAVREFLLAKHESEIENA